MAWAFVSVPGPRDKARGRPTLIAQAMRFLARREHSRAELRRKLAPRVVEGEDLDAVLDDLAKRGWLSDVRFAELTARAKARRFGPAKVAHYLKSRGVADNAIAAGIAAAGADAGASLEVIWASRFKQMPASERERARQIRFLQGRGFGLEEILRYVQIQPSGHGR